MVIIIKAVIFDLDGLLANTEPLHYRAWKDTLKKYDIPFTEDNFMNVVGKGSEWTAEFLDEKFSLTADKKILIAEKRKRFWEIIEDVKPMKGARELASKMREKFKVALATNSTRAYADKVLNTIGIDEFEVMVTGDDVKNLKPSPEIYVLAAKKLNLRPEECVAIEDSPSCVESAKKAGLKCIAVPNKYTKHQDFPDHDMTAESLAKITAEKILSLG